MDGNSCISGTRVLVSVIMDNLASDTQVEDEINTYPSLSNEAIQASIAYAAELAKGRVISIRSSWAIKFKINENFPVELVDFSKDQGHDARTVYYKGLAGAKDGIIGE